MTAAERAREEGRREGLRELLGEVREGFRWPRDQAKSGGQFLFTIAHSNREAALALLDRVDAALASGPAQKRLDGGEELTGRPGAQERSARVLLVLRAHLEAREKFFREERGVYQPPTPAAQEEAKKEIMAALFRHGETNGDREKWRKESAVLAAGIGILYSPPHNGELEKEKKDHELSRGQKLEAGWLPKLYLELWRPWKCQRGKADPVPGFAELCFERRRGER